MALTLLTFVALAAISWRLWIRWVTWRCRWEVAGTLNIASANLGVALTTSPASERLQHAWRPL